MHYVMERRLMELICTNRVSSDRLLQIDRSTCSLNNIPQQCAFEEITILPDQWCNICFNLDCFY